MRKTSVVPGAHSGSANIGFGNSASFFTTSIRPKTTTGTEPATTANDDHAKSRSVRTR